MSRNDKGTPLGDKSKRDEDTKSTLRKMVKPAAIVVGSTIVAAIAAPAVLTAVGFSTGGVVAGSIAAGIQSGIGNVAAGSLFAAVQSAGTMPFAVGAVAGVVGTLGGITSVCATRKPGDKASAQNASGKVPRHRGVTTLVGQGRGELRMMAQKIPLGFRGVRVRV